MKAALIRGAHDVLVELDMLWVQMGLHESEIEERMATVEKEIRSITHEWVECEKGNINDISTQCQSFIEEERRFRRVNCEEMIDDRSGREVKRRRVLIILQLAELRILGRNEA